MVLNGKYVTHMKRNTSMLQNPVGEIVKNFRKHNAYSQEEFAGISGVATRTLQRLESGEKANVETLRAIAAALKMDVKELVLLNEPIDAAEFAKVQEAIREQAKEVEKEISTLPRILNGKELLDVVSSFDLLNTDYPPPATHEEGTVVAELLEMVRDYGDIHGELPPTQDMEMVFEASRCLKR